MIENQGKISTMHIHNSSTQSNFFAVKSCQILAIIFLLLLHPLLYPQSKLTQTVYGCVTDDITNEPVIGVNVVIQDSTGLFGTISGINGVYILEEVPVGIIAIEFSFIGYQKRIIDNIRVVSGKALQLDVQMHEASVELNEIKVTARSRKDMPLNKLAVVSARSFSIDETNRYAGAYGDPARMAINYAGVLAARDNRNDIIVRGNSAAGLQWRLDGVEILNPNHFGATATSGGPISIINNNLLSNSDFFTGAFPAEYGNALAGVFDLNLRYGNNREYEHWAQLGWNGLEFGSEGPIVRNNNSSFIVSYRYSAVDIIEKMGINIDESAKYQDLSFKLNFPQTKTGAYSLFGMGGKSHIDILDSDDDSDEWTFENHGEDIHNSYIMGVIGLRHRYYFNNVSVETHLAVMGNEVLNKIDTFYLSQDQLFFWGREESGQFRYNLNSKVTSKISSSIILSAGLNFDRNIVSFVDSQYVNTNYIVRTNVSNETFNLFRGHLNLNYRGIKNFTINTGLHYTHIFINHENVFEPRLGLEYQFNSRNKIGYGFGLHSKTHPLVFYYVQSKTSGEVSYSNKDLKLTKSLHNIVSYDFLINEFLRLKSEVYYQYLYDVTTSSSKPWYSSLNYGTEYFVEREDSLINEASGKNYGIDLTLEKFFGNNYFLLVTLSLFDSEYKGFDEEWRSTAYNGRYAINTLGGYEWYFPKRDIAMNIGINITYTGGRPYIPFDPEATITTGQVQYDISNAYKVYREPYRRVSLRLGIKRDAKKFSTETAFDFQYRSNYTNVYLERINVLTGEIVKTHSMGFYPMAHFRINF